MSILNVRSLKVVLGIDEILSDVSFDLETGQVLAVTGSNGSGKTTLLKAIGSRIPVAEGMIQIQKGLRIGWIDQQLSTPHTTVHDSIMSTHPRLFDIKKRMAIIKDPLEYADLVNDYNQLGGYQFETHLQKHLSDFQFTPEDLNRQYHTFSDGEQRIWELIRVSLFDYDLMIMDEPTNHLDIQMCVFLEQYIQREKDYRKSFIIVSHDRILLDRLADKTLNLSHGVSTIVQGGYSALLSHLDMQFHSALRKAEDIQGKIHQLEKDVMRKKGWADAIEKRLTNSAHADKGYISHKSAKMAKRAKTSERRQQDLLDQLRKEKPFIEKQVRMSFPPYQVDQRKMVSAKDLHFSYGDKMVLCGESIDVNTLDRIAIIGPNGSGKTTFLKLLLGILDPRIGEVYVNPHVHYTHIPQSVQDFFEQPILLDNFTKLNIEETLIRQYLGSAKLRREKVLQPVDTLSCGELSRAAMVYAILNQSEFLFIDEPTNHLDIESLEVLDSLLEAFQGGFLVISHDRWFIAEHAQAKHFLDPVVDEKNRFLL